MSKYLSLLLLLALPQIAFTASSSCFKEAESIALSESKKKGNLPKNLLTIANPTEKDGDNIVVYIGARANYNYFKLKLDTKCKLLQIIDTEYAQ